MLRRAWSFFVFCLAASTLWACGGDDNPVQADGGAAADASRQDGTTAPDSVVVPDSPAPHDSTLPDTTMADTAMPDTLPPDTFVPDTFVTDTFVPDVPVGPDYTIGFTVVGLAVGATVVVVDNGTDALTATNGSFTFSTPLPTGTSYAVTIQTQPMNQTCTVAGGSGVIAGAGVSTILVNCTGMDLIGGLLQGLAVGDTVVLQDNGADNLSLANNGMFTFSGGLAPGMSYSVTVLTQPGAPAQTCTVANGAGTANSTVTSVVVTCGAVVTGDAGSVTIGGSLTGLAGGSVVLEDNGGDNITVAANGAFTFPTPVMTGAGYAVTVATQPTGPAQSCTVAMGSGAAGASNVSNVTVTCSTVAFTIGGTLTGLAASSSVILQDNGGDNVTVTADGPFTFPTQVPSGQAYAVTVFKEPTNPPQVCNVSAASGMVNAGNVTNVVVNCGSNTFTLGGKVTGLAGGDSLQLTATGGNSVFVSANGSFAFPVPLVTGTMYTVAIAANPSAPIAQTCTITAGQTGTVGNANVTSIAVSCVTNKYTVGGTVMGLVGGSVALLDNGSDPIAPSSNASFTFPTSIMSGTTYKVTVSQNPAYPPAAQACVVTNGSGTIGNGNVTNVSIKCTTSTFDIGGTITGLARNETVKLTDNGAFESKTFAGNGQPSQMFSFSKSIASGSTYTVAVASSPTAPVSETCMVTSGGGPAPVMNGDVTDVSITCTPNTFPISGTVVGLASGDSLVADDNHDTNDDQLVTSPGTSFMFGLQVASGQPYDVTVTSPTTPTPQTCVVSGGSGGMGGGTVGNAPVSVTVTCTNNAPTCTTVCQPDVSTCPAPTACTAGSDPETAAAWVICSADCSSVWISSADATGGSYHAQQICGALGYSTVGSSGTTCGDVCGSSCPGTGGTDTCSNPGAQSFNGMATITSDANGTVIGGTVSSPGVTWLCTP